jgi:hypothetical protein
VVNPRAEDHGVDDTPDQSVDTGVPAAALGREVRRDEADTQQPEPGSSRRDGRGATLEGRGPSSLLPISKPSIRKS